MKLTGQCKEDFKKWFIDNVTIKSSPIIQDSIGLSDFYRLLPSMQYGVYVDFFDKQSIRISMNQLSGTYWFDIDNFDEGEEEITRQEARTAAIEKANEIYNKK